MDPFLRGFSEQFVDIHLEKKEIENFKGILEIFNKGIKSNLDAQIGFFLGYSYAELLMQFLIMKNRLPDKEETADVFNMIKRRFPEILQQMKKVKNAKIYERDDAVIPSSEIDVEPLISVQE